MAFQKTCRNRHSKNEFVNRSNLKRSRATRIIRIVNKEFEIFKKITNVSLYVSYFLYHHLVLVVLYNQILIYAQKSC
jgi:hypothetical protein